MTISCPVCVKAVLDSEDGLNCDGDCKRWFHRECIKMNKTEYNKLSVDCNIKWLCTRTDCITASSTPMTLLSSQMASVLSKLDVLLDKVNKIDSISKDVAEIRLEVSAVSSSLANLEPRVAAAEDKVQTIVQNLTNVSTKVKSQEDRLATLESQSSSDSSLASTIEEINQRKLRAKNIMVFGLGESAKGTAGDRTSDDLAKLRTILSAIDPTLDVNTFKLFRVGKGSRNKPRPIKVIVGCEASVQKITKTATKERLNCLGDEFSNVSIGRDRTKLETAHLNSLRAELSRRSDTGEVNLTIKYINGIPKIIQSKND